jgi:hypothetical protein
VFLAFGNGEMPDQQYDGDERKLGTNRVDSIGDP